jgi:hypothetical protein
MAQFFSLSTSVIAILSLKLVVLEYITSSKSAMAKFYFKASLDAVPIQRQLDFIGCI